MEARYELRAMVADDTDVPALVPGQPTKAEVRRHQRRRACGVELIGPTADVRVFEGRGYWTGLETCGDATVTRCAGRKSGLAAAPSSARA